MLARTISRPLESAIHTPSPADRVDGPSPAGIVASTLPSSGLSRKTTSSGTIETHTESRSTARSVTVPCNGVTAVMRFVAGSILTIRPFSEPAAQTLSPAKTTDVVDSGVGKRCSTAPLRGSTRTVSDARATQTEPAPKATPVGLRLLSPLAGMENRCAIAPVVPSRRTRPSPPSSVTQAPPPPVAMPPGMNGSLVVHEDLARRDVHPGHAALVAEEHPGLAGAERDVPGLAREGDAAHDPMRARVDQAERLRRDLEPRRRRLTAAAQDEDDHQGGGGRDRHARQRPEGAAAAGRRPARRRLAPERRGGGGRERAAAREPVVGRLRHGRRDDGVERGGHLRPGLAGERGRLVHVGVDGRELAVAGERRLAGEALEEHAAQRVDVRPRVDRPPSICSGEM